MGLVVMFFLLIVGLIVGLIGWIWFLYVAFNESILWGLGCLLVPLVWLIFVVMNWREAAKPFGVIVLGYVIVGFVAGAAPFMMTAGRSGSVGTIDSISDEVMIWAKCNNPACKAEYQTSKKGYFKYVEQHANPMSPTAPPMVCEKCGEQSVFRAEKCMDPDCGLVFLRGTVPNDYPDRCPECKRSETGEILKRRRAAERPSQPVRTPAPRTKIAQSPLIGKHAPSFTLRDLNGKTVSLSDFKGNVVILDFWATWCPPCVKEVPHFVALHEQYKDQGFAMVGISLDSKGVGVVKAFAQKYRVDYPILMADRQVQAAYGEIKSIPTTFVIDAEGNLKRKYIGYRDKAVFEADIQTLLADAELKAKPLRIERAERRVTTNAKSTTKPDVIADPNAVKPRIKGGIAFVSDRDRYRNREIYLMNVDGTEQINLTKNLAHDSSPSLSPDGKKIVFASNRDRNYEIRDRNYEIYVMNADGSEPKRLTNNSAVDAYPSWSLDGTKIAFVSDRDGNYEIYVMNADGSEQKRVTNDSSYDTYPCLSPDGTKVAFTSLRDGNTDIYVMNVDGTEQKRLTNNPAVDGFPSWSPDGSRIAFASDRDGNYEIYIMNADGSEQKNFTNNPAEDTGPTWSPDGKKVAFASKRDGNFDIYIMNPDGTEQERLTNNRASDSFPSWSPFLPLENKTTEE